MSISPVEISNQVHAKGQRTFSAKKAIESFFQSTEKNVSKSCESENYKASTCSKGQILSNSPRFIIIQLKRFTSNYLRSRRTAALRKITEKSEPFTDLNIHTSLGPTNYEVIATIEHLGETLQSGHYVCYKKLQNQWVKCDDEIISVIKDNYCCITENAYIIMLKKTEVTLPISSV